MGLRLAGYDPTGRVTMVWERFSSAINSVGPAYAKIDIAAVSFISSEQERYQNLRWFGRERDSVGLPGF